MVKASVEAKHENEFDISILNEDFDTASDKLQEEILKYFKK